jgi:hypothetical protein
MHFMLFNPFLHILLFTILVVAVVLDYLSFFIKYFYDETNFNTFNHIFCGFQL